MGIRSPQLLPGMIPLIRTPCIIDLSPIPVTNGMLLAHPVGSAKEDLVPRGS